MKKVLVDTSVWIDAFSGTKNSQTDTLKKLIEQNFPVVTCPVIIQEILQGIGDDREFAAVKAALSGFDLLHIPPIEAAYGAAMLYRNIRRKGVTIRKSNDCLIAYYAIYYKAALLHRDEDFNRIARYSSLAVFKT